MRPWCNPLTLLLTMQVFVVFAGTIATTMALKANGYPDYPIMRWNPVSVFVRNWGLLGIAVPGCWLVANLKRGNYPLSVKEIGIGIGIALLLSIFYSWTAANSATRGIPLGPAEDETSEQSWNQRPRKLQSRERHWLNLPFARKTP